MPSALILMYHRIGGGVLADRQPGEHIYAVEPAVFARQLEVLESRACPVVGIEAVAAASRGRGDLPAGAVALSFDDGNATDFHHVFPALGARGWPAVFLVSPALVGRPGYAAWSELREMAGRGMTIGAHGLDHTPLADLDEAALARQMRESHREIAERVGRPPRFLSLPNGAGGRREIAAALAAGFEVVLGSVPGRVGAGDGLPLARFAVRRADSLERFTALVTRRPLALLAQSLRHRAIGAVRAGLGERLYQRARRALAPGA